MFRLSSKYWVSMFLPCIKMKLSASSWWKILFSMFWRHFHRDVTLYCETNNIHILSSIHCACRKFMTFFGNDLWDLVRANLRTIHTNRQVATSSVLPFKFLNYIISELITYRRQYPCRGLLNPFKHNILINRCDLLIAQIVEWWHNFMLDHSCSWDSFNDRCCMEKRSQEGSGEGLGWVRYKGYVISLIWCSGFGILK